MMLFFHLVKHVAPVTCSKCKEDTKCAIDGGAGWILVARCAVPAGRWRKGSALAMWVIQIAVRSINITARVFIIFFISAVFL